MLRGIPYLGERNTDLKNEILNKQVDEYIQIDMLSLIERIKPKDSLLVLNGTGKHTNRKFLTWLEDIQFDYVGHVCEIPYLSYETYRVNHRWNIQINKADNHLEYEIVQEEGTPSRIKYILLRHNFRLELQRVDIGKKLLVYNLTTNRLTEYEITAWTDADRTAFSLSELYLRYKEYCYKDEVTEFSNHEKGYTFITSSIYKIDNKEARLRTSYKLKAYDGNVMNKLRDYRDTRVYDFFTYMHKLRATSTGSLSDRQFKYRRLSFESYLFCNLREEREPIDKSDEWDKLGVEIPYIKITDGTIPFFIKCEWLNHSNIVNKATWRRVRA